MDRVSVSEFAEAVNITPQGVRKAIRTGRVKANKVGSFWTIPAREINKYYERSLEIRRKRSS